MPRARQRILHSAQMALNDANEIPGYRIRALVYDDGTATAGQYDPAQAATNARRMIADGAVAAVGPQMSGSGKAMAPILSEGELATTTPTSTNPDITDPKFAPERQSYLLPHGHHRRVSGARACQLFL
jgi:branched-chain amino acid transport system substrate-binding protein